MYQEVTFWSQKIKKSQSEKMPFISGSATF